jgi:hypothetical protein
LAVIYFDGKLSKFMLSPAQALQPFGLKSVPAKGISKNKEVQSGRNRKSGVVYGQ